MVAFFETLRYVFVLFVATSALLGSEQSFVVSDWFDWWEEHWLDGFVGVANDVLGAPVVLGQGDNRCVGVFVCKVCCVFDAASSPSIYALPGVADAEQVVVVDAVDDLYLGVVDVLVFVDEDVFVLVWSF